MPGGASWIRAPKPVGRPIKQEAAWNATELDYMVSKVCLRRQAGKNLQVRAAELSGLFGKEITATSLRQLYHGRSVTM